MKYLALQIAKIVFFLSGFSFTNIHDTQDSRRRERLSLSLLSNTSTRFKVLRHQPGDCCRELTAAHNQQPDSNRERANTRESVTTRYTLFKKLAQKPCKGTFFEDFYLNSQPLIPASSTDQSLGLRKSSRQSLQY